MEQVGDVHKMRDSKNRLIGGFVAGTAFIAFGPMLIIGGITHNDQLKVILGIGFTLAGLLMLFFTNKSLNEKIHNFTSGIFGDQA